MTDCVFCKIVSGEIPSYRIYEDDEFLAFLDINPNTEGMTVLVTKRHYPSDVFQLPDATYTKLLQVAKRVANLLNKSLEVKKTALVIEGMGINHAHLKLYPLHGIEEWKFGEAPDRVYFQNYPGYITTKIGPEAKPQELEKLARKIRAQESG